MILCSRDKDSHKKHAVKNHKKIYKNLKKGIDKSRELWSNTYRRGDKLKPTAVASPPLLTPTSRGPPICVYVIRVFL